MTALGLPLNFFAFRGAIVRTLYNLAFPHPLTLLPKREKVNRIEVPLPSWERDLG